MLRDHESSEEPWPYPSNNKTITLPSGRVVRFYDLIIITGLGEPSFSVHYRSETDRSDKQARQDEAAEVIQYFGKGEGCENIKRGNASICSTREQAAAKEFPEEIFLFERRDGGSWRYKGKAPPPPRTT
jgi:hypothetical protein